MRGWGGGVPLRPKIFRLCFQVSKEFSTLWSRSSAAAWRATAGPESGSEAGAGEALLGEKKRKFSLRGLMFSQWGRDHFLDNVPTLRDSFEACNKPILDFLDTISDAIDVLDANLTLLLRHLAE